jgi:DNA-binding transcriptional MerR regulator
MRSIGEMARDSGLSVSALRFYDGAGVLAPAWTDPRSGYRWYGDEQLPDARLVARLRRVGMPLPEIRRVLAERAADPDAVRGLLDAHVRRLEDGLADARRELSSVRALLAPEASKMTRLTIPAPELAAALDAVRFAASTDPELPSLAGVLFDVEGGVLTLVATDRYRLAVARVPVEHAYAALSVIVPTALADDIRALLDGADQVEVSFDDDRISAEAAGRKATGVRLDHDYPDYRRLTRLDDAVHRVTVEAAALRDSLAAGPEAVRVLTVTPGGTLAVSDRAADGVAVNRDFLLDALNAGACEQLVLELGGPISPLAIRLPGGRDESFSMLMPVRIADED